MLPTGLLGPHGLLSLMPRSGPWVVLPKYTLSSHIHPQSGKFPVSNSPKCQSVKGIKKNQVPFFQMIMVYVKLIS